MPRRSTKIAASRNVSLSVTSLADRLVVRRSKMFIYVPLTYDNACHFFNAMQFLVNDLSLFGPVCELTGGGMIVRSHPKAAEQAIQMTREFLNDKL